MGDTKKIETWGVSRFASLERKLKDNPGMKVGFIRGIPALVPKTRLDRLIDKLKGARG